MRKVAKGLFVALAAAAAMLPSQAMAQDGSGSRFEGFRVGAHVGLAGDDVVDDDVFTFGANVGYDFNLGGAVVGGTLEWQDSGENGFDRDLSATVRAGGVIGDNVLLYGAAGYSNLRVAGINLDGARIAGGVEVAITDRIYANVEHRYTNYELGAEAHQTVLGLGFRFR